MSRSFVPSALRGAVALALTGLLAACSSSSDSPGSPPGGVTPTPSPTPTPGPTALIGGRLLYSLDGVTDTLQMFDETVAANRFTGTTVAAGPNTRLVLANNGLTAAMLDGDRLSIVDSGLEHLRDDDPHTHKVEVVSAVPLSGVQQVVATRDHFSVLLADGTSRLLEASDGADAGKSWSNTVYPTLELPGEHFLVFTANAGNPADVDMTVVDAQGASGEEGLIFLRPNATGVFGRSITCANGVQQTAQTERFTIALCGDGTLRWLASGVETPEGHPAGGGRVIHTSQRYPATETRRAGATGEVVASANGFIENITGILPTRSDENVILVWAAEQLWLVSLHFDHPHRGSFFADLPEGTRIIAAAAATVDEAVTVISDRGRSSSFRFEINNQNNPVRKGGVDNEQLGSATATWTAGRTHIVGGPFDFYVINRDQARLYHIDAHDPDDEYHLHATLNHPRLADALSAVYAHLIDEDHHHHHHD